MCCGLTDDASYEAAGHYCGFDLKEGTYLSDQISTKIAINNLGNRTSITAPFFHCAVGNYSALCA